MEVKNKVVLVTGGGDGIGREVVLLLLQRGAKVAAVDINEAALQKTTELAGELKKNLSTHVVNITDKTAVEALPEAVMAAHGSVDAITNNAGIIQPFVKVKDLAYKDIDRIINVNLYGVIYVTKTFLPHLLARPEGHIVNISSMGGFLPVPGQSLYGATKAAVKLFTEALHSELMNTNVGVTVVFPGAIGTNIAANSGLTNMPEQSASSSKIKMTAPSVAAAMIVEGIEKKKYRVLIGSDARTMDLLCRLMPERAARIIYSQMRSLLPA